MKRSYTEAFGAEACVRVEADSEESTDIISVLFGYGDRRLIRASRENIDWETDDTEVVVQIATTKNLKTQTGQKRLPGYPNMDNLRMEQFEAMYRMRNEISKVVKQLDVEKKEEEYKFDLGRNIFVVCCNFGSGLTTLIHIREYKYSTTQQKMLATSNGISFKVREWFELVDIMQNVREYLPQTELDNEKLMMRVIQFMIIDKAMEKTGSSDEKIYTDFAVKNFDKLLLEYQRENILDVYRRAVKAANIHPGLSESTLDVVLNQQSLTKIKTRLINRDTYDAFVPFIQIHN